MYVARMLKCYNYPCTAAVPWPGALRQPAAYLPRTRHGHAARGALSARIHRGFATRRGLRRLLSVLFAAFRRGFSGGKKICPTYFEIQGTYFELCPTYFPPSPMRAQSAEKEFSLSRTRKGRPGGEKPRHLHGAYSTSCRSKIPLPQAVCKSPFRTLPFALIYINLRTAGNNSTANLYGIKAYAPPEWI